MSWSRRRRRIEGYALITVGAALIVLPGPGIPLIFAGAARLRSSKTSGSHSR
jgi:hypothetical protein